MQSHRERQVVGSAHPRVREYLEIRRNRRRDPRAFAVDGTWIIARAARSSAATIDAVFVCPALVRGPETVALVDELERRTTPVFVVSEKVFARMADRDGPDGLAAIARVRPSRLDDIPIGRGTRIVVADAFDLAGNLGTVIRCADGAGAAAVVVTDRRIRISHPLVARASMGTVFSTPVIDTTRDEALAWFRAKAVRVVTADPAASCSYRSADYGDRVAIVLGSEREGLSDFWRTHGDVAVAIPMLGVADSLNVGHAAALLLYEALGEASE